MVAQTHVGATRARSGLPCARIGGVKATWAKALSWRVSQQFLAEPAPTVVEAARRVGGIQAQVMSAAELAAGLRAGQSPAAVRAALWAERSLVKTWAMRGTLHLLPADELPMWVAALRHKEGSIRRGQAWERYHGVTVAQLEAITAAVGEVLGTEPVTREELAHAVSGATGSAELGRAVRAGFGGTILKSAAANGELCFAPDRGRNVTFVDPRAWLGGGWKEPDVDAATTAVVHRFLDAYGPATAADLARWWGVPAAEGKKLLRPLAAELIEVDLDGVRCWLTPLGAEGLAAARPLRSHVRLLPAFDTYVLAPHGHRRHAWPDGLHGRISRTAGWITPTLVVDGRIAGVWSLGRASGAATVEIEAFGALSKPVRAAAEAGARSYEALLGTPLTVTFTTVGA